MTTTMTDMEVVLASIWEMALALDLMQEMALELDSIREMALSLGSMREMALASMRMSTTPSTIIRLADHNDIHDDVWYVKEAVSVKSVLVHLKEAVSVGYLVGRSVGHANL